MSADGSSQNEEERDDSRELGGSAGQGEAQAGISRGPGETVMRSEKALNSYFFSVTINYF